MTQNNAHRSMEIDFFEFIDIILKKKIIVLGFIFFSALAAAAYSFLTPEAPTEYAVKIYVRYPINNDFLSTDPGKPQQKMNFAEKVFEWIRIGTYKGAVQKALNLSEVPSIEWDAARGQFPLIMMRIVYRDKETAVRMLDEIHRALRSSPVLSQIIDAEKALLTAKKAKSERRISDWKKTINSLDRHKSQAVILEDKTRCILNRLISLASFTDTASGAGSHIPEQNMAGGDLPCPQTIHELIEYLERQRQQLALSNIAFTRFKETLEQLIVKEKGHVNDLLRRMNVMNKTFDKEGKTYITTIEPLRTSPFKILGISTIIGLFLGVLIAFGIEIRARRAG